MEAQRVFAEFVERAREDGGPGIEALCAIHAGIADELRALHAEWLTRTSTQSFFDQLETLVGGEVDPGISLDREPDRETPRDTQALLERVAEMTRGQRYSIKGELARGGMGMIYKVWDRDLRRTLAMKVVLGKDGPVKEGSTAGLDRDRLGRFLEEAQITGQLDHPGIVPVHELGLDSEGRVYFTMRLVRGKELREIIEQYHLGQGSWTLVRALQVIQRICEAMAFAHEKGVVHRDLKPANVMVGRFGEVYVMDWGLAKIVGREDRRASESRWELSQSMVVGSDRAAEGELDTMEGSIFGTPCYMAPEQARGQQDRIGPRSDVYSVGSILYHLLTGRMPYVPLGERMHPHAVLAMLLQGPPTPVRECDASIPDELVAICSKAMAREPEERYESMLAMADDLQAFLEGRVVRAHRTGAAAEFTKWVRRNKLSAAALAGLILVVVGGAGGFAWQQNRLAGRIRAEQRAALEAAEVAARNEREALHQSYVANLIAADVSARTGEIQEAKRRLAACDEGRRGWEWRHVGVRVDASVARLPHPDEVLAVATDPELFRVATGAADFSVRLWQLGADEPAETLTGHAGAVVSLAMDGTGRLLVSGSEDGTARLWDVESGRNLLVLRGHEGPVSSVDVTADGRRVVSGGLDDTARVWDADTGRELASVVPGAQPVGAVAFAPDGARFAAGTEDGRLSVFETESGRLLLEVQAHANGISGLAFSADGGRLASSSVLGALAVRDAKTGEELLAVEGGDPIFCLAFDPAGGRVATGGLDKGLRLVDVETGRTEAVLNGHDEPLRALAFSGDGTRIVSGSTDRTARVWAAEVGGATTPFSVGEYPLVALAFAPDGRRLAACDLFDGHVRIWDAPSGALLLELEVGDGVNALAFGPDGAWLAAGLDEGSSVLLLDARTGEPRLAPLAGHEASVSALAVAPDGERLASASADGTVRLWSTANGAPVGELRGHELPVTSVAYDPDGARVAAGAMDGSVRVWRTPDSDPVLTLAAHGESVQDVAFAPDGALLATASLDGTVRLFDGASGEPLATLSGHDGAVYAVRFDAAGERLVSSSFDKTLVVWDVASRDALLALRGHAQPVAALALDGNGTRIASGCYDGTVFVWETASAAERFLARRAAALVRERRERMGSMARVAASIQDDAALGEELRREALALVAAWGAR